MWGFNVYKYTLLICHALVDKDKLLRNYISIPSCARVANVIVASHNVTGLPNMCGAINNIHCKLYREPSQSFILGDYWCRHYIYSVLLQGICDNEFLGGMYV